MARWFSVGDVLNTFGVTLLLAVLIYLVVWIFNNAWNASMILFGFPEMGMRQSIAFLVVLSFFSAFFRGAVVTRNRW